jgi:hypothetical protein
MSLEVELKRTHINYLTIDVGWRLDDLVFHFYAPDFMINDLDKKLDPIFTQIFNLEIVNKTSLIEELHKSVYAQFKGDEQRSDIYEKTDFFKRLKDIEKVP